MAVNVKGVFLGLRHVLPVMIKQGRGAVVNTASVAGLVASPGMPAYVASKHAVIGLTKTAAGEVARSGIRVNAVCPGPIDTRMIHSLEAMLNPNDPASVGARYQSNIPIGRYGTPEEVANVVQFLCSDLAGNVTVLIGRARLSALHRGARQDLRLGSAPGPRFMGSRRHWDLPLPSDPRAASSSRVGRSASRAGSRSRPGAVCETARGHRARSAPKIASGKRPSASERASLSDAKPMSSVVTMAVTMVLILRRFS